ncbi:MAG: hypothetical protein UY80_C0002G0009 [Parcubacteria group bacterium GW2011_GWB1_53_43]|nr:MAG: hypothetical protein UY80_C0002G0009 [Parcubacteria group bacterium GW2011_GWB1_53_43]
MPPTPNMMSEVERVLNRVRPQIRMHGGDLTLVTVTEGVVTLKISGACAGCALTDLTYKEIIGGLLRAEVSGVTSVEVTLG